MPRLGWLGRYLWGGWAGATGIFCLLALWQSGSEVYGGFVLPSPMRTFQEIAAIVHGPVFRDVAMQTCARTFLGFALAAGLGGLAGAVAGFSFAALRLLKPVVAVILGIPQISWIILVMIWFGATGTTPVIAVTIAALPVSFAGALEGVATRDRSLDAMARVYGVGPLRRFTSITLPHLLSYLFPAWTITAGTAWKVAVMAELLANAGGFGGELATARTLFDIPQVTAWTVIVAIFALLTDYGILHPLRECFESWRRAGLPRDASP
jgi:NitT/TauT family transport system permease protein